MEYQSSVTTLMYHLRIILYGSCFLGVYLQHTNTTVAGDTVARAAKATALDAGLWTLTFNILTPYFILGQSAGDSNQQKMGNKLLPEPFL